MYDHIRIKLPYPFNNNKEKSLFCDRFGMFTRDDKKGICHNKGYENLTQNRGIYMRLETAGTSGSLGLSFSLHKLYNSFKGKGLCNYNAFSFAQANEASGLVSELLGIDLSKAVVKKYEVGMNIITRQPPDDYMKQLDMIEVKNRKMRILEDVRQKEYKQYSTHKDRHKRIIYIFYNKTFEARSKLKQKDKKEAVPDNIMRIEIDYHRPIGKVYFSDLFSPVFQFKAKEEFKQKFIENLRFKEYLTKTKGISNKQLEILRTIENIGFANYMEVQKRQYADGMITKNQYRYAVKLAKDIIVNSIAINRQSLPITNEIKPLIIEGLNF